MTQPVLPHLDLSIGAVRLCGVTLTVAEVEHHLRAALQDVLAEHGGSLCDGAAMLELDCLRVNVEADDPAAIARAMAQAVRAAITASLGGRR